jgi:hypothetical protein
MEGDPVTAFIVWWVVGFFGSMIGLTKMASEGYGDFGDSLGYVSSAGGVALWLAWVQLRPQRPCTGRCNGTGKLTDPADRKYTTPAPCCNGSGKQFRWFVFPHHPMKVAARRAAAGG